MPVSSMLIGRLGNSMFQIAASIGYARNYGYEWAVQEIPHNNESAIHRVFPNLPKTNFKGQSYQEHPHGFCKLHQKDYDLCHFDYHPIPDVGEHAFLRGFWQSYKYFEHCQDEVKKVFELPHIKGYEDYTSIHIRLGDYLLHSGSFPPVTIDYIRLALRHTPSKRLLVFSDDIPHCKSMFGDTFEGFTIEYSEGRNELEDLSLMASCGHHIIANSTFSWWGAYLGHNPNRVVVTPSAQTWFGPTSGVKQPVVDLLTENWIQIHTR